MSGDSELSTGLILLTMLSLDQSSELLKLHSEGFFPPLSVFEKARLVFGITSGMLSSVSFCVLTCSRLRDNRPASVARLLACVTTLACSAILITEGASAIDALCSDKTADRNLSFNSALAAVKMLVRVSGTFATGKTLALCFTSVKRRLGWVEEVVVEQNS